MTEITRDGETFQIDIGDCRTEVHYKGLKGVVEPADEHTFRTLGLPFRYEIVGHHGGPAATPEDALTYLFGNLVKQAERENQREKYSGQAACDALKAETERLVEAEKGD